MLPLYPTIVSGSSGAVWEALDLSGGTITSPKFVLARTADTIEFDSDAGDAASPPTTANFALYDVCTLLTLDISEYTNPRVELAAYWEDAASAKGSTFLLGLGDNADPASATKVSIAGWVDGSLGWLCRRYGQVGSASSSATKTATDRFLLVHDFDDGSHAEGLRASFRSAAGDTANVNTASENKAWDTTGGSLYVYLIAGVYDSTTPPTSETRSISAWYRVSEGLGS